jgi:hypothetical protein
MGAAQAEPEIDGARARKGGLGGRCRADAETLTTHPEPRRFGWCSGFHGRVVDLSRPRLDRCVVTAMTVPRGFHLPCLTPLTVLSRLWRVGPSIAETGDPTCGSWFLSARPVQEATGVGRSVQLRLRQRAAPLWRGRVGHRVFNAPDCWRGAAAARSNVLRLPN